MEARSVERSPIQTTGYVDIYTGDYAFTVCSGTLVVTFEFLKEADIREMISCLSCMLVDDEKPTDEQRQTDLDHAWSGKHDYVLRQGFLSSEPR